MLSCGTLKEPSSRLCLSRSDAAGPRIIDAVRTKASGMQASSHFKVISRRVLEEFLFKDTKVENLLFVLFCCYCFSESMQSTNFVGLLISLSVSVSYLLTDLPRFITLTNFSMIYLFTASLQTFKNYHKKFKKQ